jgi:hypothetical protein
MKHLAIFEDFSSDPNKPVDWSKWPCLVKLKDGKGPKGEQIKLGEGTFKNIQFYPGGKCAYYDEVLGLGPMKDYRCTKMGLVVGDDLDQINF